LFDCASRGIFTQYLPVVVVVVSPCIIGVNEVFGLNSSPHLVRFWKIREEKKEEAPYIKTTSTMSSKYNNFTAGMREVNG